MPKGVDPLKPGTPEWEARQSRHRHNAFLGDVARAHIAMDTISKAPTVTEKGQQLARQTGALIHALGQELKTRRDIIEVTSDAPRQSGSRK